MIRNMEKFNTWLPAGFDGEFQWEFITWAFNGTKITPMDYDAVIERKGHRLIMETKEKGKKVDLGQAITLMNEWRLGATILQISGKCPEEINGYWLFKEGGWTFNDAVMNKEKTFVKAEWMDISYLVHRWYHWANKSTPMPRVEFEDYMWRCDYDKKEDELTVRGIK